MATITTDRLTDSIQNLKQYTETVLNDPTVENFENFEAYLDDVEDFVRETQQAMWANEAKTAIKNLDKNNPLSDADKEVIRVFIVSDAEHYLAMENNFPDWIRELKRLTDDLVSRANMIDRHTIGDIRGVLKDAMRLVPDIRNYLDEKSRVQKFEASLGSMDAATQKMLVKLMNEQLSSGNR